MGLAIELAREAAAEGEVPVGAVVLDAGGAVIGRGRNLREAHADPLAHAEVKAMTQAARSLGTWNLADCTLIVTLEPCPMCAGACLQTHVGRIVFGAWDAKLGACGSIWDIPRDPHVGHVPEVVGGVREMECARLMTDFSLENGNSILQSQEILSERKKHARRRQQIKLDISSKVTIQGNRNM